MKMKLIVTAFLLTFAIPAIAQSDADLEQAGTSVKKAVMIADEDLTELRQIIRVWKQKCENKDSFCVIRECDLHQVACKKGNILLFRGEKALYSSPGTSALMRAIFTGSPYSEGKTAAETLKQYSNDLGVLKDFDLAPQGENTVLTINPKSGEREWIWKNSKQKIFPFSRADRRRTAPLASYLFHIEASYPYFQETDFNIATEIDPLISTSTSPAVAAAFANTLPNTKGRVLVYSVSEKDMMPLCDEFASFKPGTILDPRRCSIANEYEEESEFDLVLYAKPDWIYRSFIVNGNETLK